MKKITHLLLALASTFAYGQTNLFTPVDISEEELVGQQLVVFDMLMA
jgi:hypothetical protein